MAKHPLLKKATAGGWNIADPNGGASGEGKTREGLNAVLKQCQADISKIRMAKWKVTLTDGKNERTEEVGGESYKGAEKAVQRKMKPGETIKSMTVAAALPEEHQEQLLEHYQNVEPQDIAQEEVFPEARKYQDWVLKQKEAGVAKNADEDNPMCICGHPFYEHNEQGYCDVCDPNSSTRGPEKCGGFTPLNEPLADVHLGARNPQEYQAAARELIAMFGNQPPEDWQSPAQDWAAATGLDADYVYDAVLKELERRKMGAGDTQECCGAFKPRHKENCKVYNENFDKTIQQLKGLKKGSYLAIAEAKEAYQKGLKEGRFIETAEGIRDTKDGSFLPWLRPDARVAQLREMSTSLKMAADELEKSAAPAWEVGDEVKANMGHGQFFRGEIESINGDQAVVVHGKLKKTVPLAHLEEAHPVQFIPAETKSEPMGSMKPDDYCQACGNEVANRECAHGLLCDNCDAEIHGAVGAPCDSEDQVIYKKDFIVPDSELGGLRAPRKKGAAPKRFPEETKYPDTADGAIQALKELSVLNCEGCTARPDPSVRGVWEVKNPKGQRAIVYLAGYPDPMGNTRISNDFEVEDSWEEEPVGKRVLRKWHHDQKMKKQKEEDKKMREKLHEEFLQRNIQQTSIASATGTAPAMEPIERNHLHNWRGGAEVCPGCGAQRCKGRGVHTGFRCTKEAMENGFCGVHQHQSVGDHTSALKLNLTSKLLQKQAGGQDFWVIEKGKNAQEAYRTASDKAAAEYGHQEGYSGHINSTHRLVMITPPKGIQPKDYASLVASYYPEYDYKTNTEKWPKTVGVNKDVEQKPGTKCQHCKKGMLTLETKEDTYTPSTHALKLAYTHTYEQANSIMDMLRAGVRGADFALFGSLRKKEKSEHDIDIKVIPQKGFSFELIFRAMMALGLNQSYNEFGALPGWDMVGFEGPDKMRVELWFPEGVLGPDEGPYAFSQFRFNR